MGRVPVSARSFLILTLTSATSWHFSCCLFLLLSHFITEFQFVSAAVLLLLLSLTAAFTADCVICLFVLVSHRHKSHWTCVSLSLSLLRLNSLYFSRLIVWRLAFLLNFEFFCFRTNYCATWRKSRSSTEHTQCAHQISPNYIYVFV